MQPVFELNALGTGVAGVVFDGVGTFLSNSLASVGTASTMFAVFRDSGSSGGSTGPCCSGVVFYEVSEMMLKSM